MRIASNQYHTTMNSALQAANEGLTHVMQQMASGQRVLKPSDDSIASLRLARLSRDEASLGQYRDNIGALQSRLKASEVTLDSMQEDLQAVRDLLVWAADAGNTGDDLNAMSGSMKTLHDSLLYLANSKNAEGRYLFSGTASDQPVVDAAYAYQGNTQTQQVAVADNMTVPANVTLETMAGFLQQFNTLTGQLAVPGVTADGVHADVEAMLASLDQTLGAVAGKIGQLGGRQNILQTLDSNQASVSLSNQQSALKLGQIDYGEAATRLNSYTLALQATQKAYAKVSSLSLFNAI
ncbi:flagellar hook-associated protein FlgL [Roseateles amylovorans]|uniref:Flagellar hook-associated protein FlgL n=1 Tax=Roseateles amylovorans TaxID=2978473 RepID=A0ABY6AW18_9BURK|nr:flagellar hook-associated protein FlgL [Roseateles amylovorans]UXH76877.1 flagellar hook-associated protein FlgL [Roseateles amylovorans]